jgi:hypothetical protein
MSRGVTDMSFSTSAAYHIRNMSQKHHFARFISKTSKLNPILLPEARDQFPAEQKHFTFPPNL